MKTILVPLDGSARAGRALPYATTLAGAERARLVRRAQRCLEPTWAGSAASQAPARLILVRAVKTHAFPGTDPGPAQVAAIEEGEKDLAGVADQLRTDGLEVEPHIYYDEPAQAIQDAARRHRADLIVMSTHGRTGPGRLVYGSVADAVLRHAEVPVLMVPPGAERPWPADRPLRILVPLDGSELAADALTAAQSLADAFGADLVLLRAIEPRYYPLYGEGYASIPIDDEVLQAEALRYLEQVAAPLRDGARTVQVRVTAGRATSQIVRVAREEGIDLIAMATHGRGGLARLVLGSVAAEALHRADVPLLLTRPTNLQGTRDSHPDESVPLALTRRELELARAGLDLLAGTASTESQAAAAQELTSKLSRAADARPTVLI
jgi:nucleotide-binding universal stress UspA family protein